MANDINKESRFGGKIPDNGQQRSLLEFEMSNLPQYESWEARRGEAIFSDEQKLGIDTELADKRQRSEEALLATLNKGTDLRVAKAVLRDYSNALLSYNRGRIDFKDLSSVREGVYDFLRKNSPDKKKAEDKIISGFLQQDNKYKIVK